MATHIKQPEPRGYGLNRSHDSIDYSPTLFEVPGDSLPETLRERQQIALLQGFDRNQATFNGLKLKLETV
jgi:hypothetical protein